MISLDLRPVHLGVEQRRELARAEQRGQRLGVDLVEQRVAARPGERRVELAVDLAELGQVARPAGREPGDLGAFGSSVARRVAISTIAGSITWRTSNSWVTSALRSSPAKFTSGRCSATTDRLPRRSR